MAHDGKNVHRLSREPLEWKFHDEWKKHQEQNHTLEYILYRCVFTVEKVIVDFMG
jgi:hypothetical protein